MTRINEQNLRKKLNRSMEQKRVESPVRSTGRLGEIKKDKTPGQDRIERLAAIGRQYGAEFLEHEITVLERKIADLRAAVKLVNKYAQCLMNAIVELRADRELVRDALRSHAICIVPGFEDPSACAYCKQCDANWSGEPERHEIGCIAEKPT